MKFVFPQLRKLCESRGVAWSEVDLRWGITDEERAEGKVLPLCLEEINRCRPYFIGLLGERYGYVPEYIPADLLETHPWLVEHQTRSITELEIIHGALNNENISHPVFFYFRDPEYMHSLPPEARHSDFESESSESQEKLIRLKERIRRAGMEGTCILRENYKNIQELGQWILHDFTNLIDNLFPETNIPELLDREALDHDTIAQDMQKIYIAREEYFDVLDAHASGESPPLVILGESGAGKSALLANWYLRYREKNPEDFVIIHFIGSTPYSADWTNILRRFMGEIKRRFKIEQNIPEKPEELRASFMNWLFIAASRAGKNTRGEPTKIILILDGLNQLEDRDGAPDLVWLPHDIPPNIRVLVSTLPGRPLDEIQKRNYPSCTVTPLNTDERKKLILLYLKQYAKALPDNLVDHIAESAQTENPRFLRMMLEELRLYGEHTTLKNQIEHYLGASSIIALCNLVFERYEKDYERDMPGLVGDTFSLLWASRRGLSESEILEILGPDKDKLPHAIWSPLFLAAEHLLIIKSGLIGFGNESVRAAVEQRYLTSPYKQKKTYLRLADYFTTQELEPLKQNYFVKVSIGPRKIEELPWLLSRAQAWQRLSELLADLEFFSSAWQTNPFDVMDYWGQIESHSDLTISRAYQHVLENPGNYIDKLWYIAALFASTDYTDESLELEAYRIEHCRRTNDLKNLSYALFRQGLLFMKKDQPQCALSILNEAGNLALEQQDGYLRSICLGNLASLYTNIGDYQKATILLEEAHRLAQESGEGNIADILRAKSHISYARGLLDDALALAKESERYARSAGDVYGLAASLGNQAIIKIGTSDWHDAQMLNNEVIELCRKMNNRYDLANALGNHALILKGLHDLKSAMIHLKEQENIARRYGYRTILAKSLGEQAYILEELRDYPAALTLWEEQESIYEECNDVSGMVLSIANHARLLTISKKRIDALRVAQKGLRLAEDAGLAEIGNNLCQLIWYLRNPLRWRLLWAFGWLRSFFYENIILWKENISATRRWILKLLKKRSSQR